MRTAPLLRYMMVFACVFAAADADAAERIIRPRRVNRSAPGIFAPGALLSRAGAPEAAPALSGPVPDPVQTIPPPEEPTATYQPEEENPPPVPEPKREVRQKPRKGKRRGWGWNADRELELQSEFAARGPESEFAEEGEEELPEGSLKNSSEEENVEGFTEDSEESSGPKITAPGLPVLVSDDAQLDFADPLRVTGDIQEAKRFAFEPLQPVPSVQSVRPPQPVESEQETETPEEPVEEIEESPAEEPEPVIEEATKYPTPAEVEDYRRKLEFRLLERYNNLPDHAGEVAKVTVVLSKPLQPSMDGTRLRADFDQLVYDTWGRRIPALEKEYYVVTFSSGGVRQVRSDPSIRVGLNLERTYSEPGPDSGIGEKIRSLPSDHAFRAAPSVEVPVAKMPDWWRPEFAEDGY